MTDQLPAVDFTGLGPRVGERFPEVKLPNQHGEPVDLQRARGSRRALVVFFRSANW